MGIATTIRSFLEKTGDFLQPLVLLGIRLIWGIVFFTMGLDKLVNLQENVEFFSSITIPWPFGEFSPTFNVYFEGIIELVGGLLLIFGLFSRFTALVLSIAMLTALFSTAFSPSFIFVWKSFLGVFTGMFSGQLVVPVRDLLIALEGYLFKTPILAFVSTLIIFSFGPGALSLDRLVRGKKKTEKFVS